MELTVSHLCAGTAQQVPNWDSAFYRCLEDRDRRNRTRVRRQDDKPHEGIVKANRVLLIGRLWELALYRAEVLRSHGFRVITPRTVSEAVEEIRRSEFDIAVLSYTLSNEVVEHLAEQVREHCPSCPLIVIADSQRFDKRISPTQTVIADEGPAALIAALRRVAG
ncbi:MAG: response regulator [Acidobacteria bacterium]|nr:response regulator [Acidobacteriota bacterium]MBV9435430.1 response regulator [Acidobacteriota bacterium]